MKNQTFCIYEAPLVEIIQIAIENGYLGSREDEGKYDPIAPEGGLPF